MRLANRWYTQLLPANSARITEVERNAEFLTQLGELNFPARLTTIDLAGANLPDEAFTRAIAGQSYYVLFRGPVGNRESGRPAISARSPRDCTKRLVG